MEKRESSSKTRGYNNLLSPEEVACILGVESETLSVWRSTKRYPLPFVKIGRSVKYRVEDIHAFVESRRVGGQYEG